MSAIIMLIGCIVICFLTILTCLASNTSLHDSVMEKGQENYMVNDKEQENFVMSHMQKGGSNVKTQKVHRK